MSIQDLVRPCCILIGCCSSNFTLFGLHFVSCSWLMLFAVMYPDQYLSVSFAVLVTCSGWFIRSILFELLPSDSLNFLHKSSQVCSFELSGLDNGAWLNTLPVALLGHHNKEDKVLQSCHHCGANVNCLHYRGLHVWVVNRVWLTFFTSSKQHYSQVVDNSFHKN